MSRESVSGSSLQCSTCRKTYFGNETHLELTAASGAKNYGEPMPIATELFRCLLSTDFILSDLHMALFFLVFHGMDMIVMVQSALY